MTNKELETRIKEIERLLKRHDDDILQLTENVDGLIEEKHRKQSHHEFKVGDRVQFKSWEEMEKEFGVVDGDIACCHYFTRKMKHLCGTYATISEMLGNNVELVDFTAVKNTTGWSYSLDMLKPATDEPKCKFKVGDKVKIKGNNEVGEITQYNDWLSLSIYYLVEFTDESDWYTEKDLEPYTEPCWTFTDDEKTILRNLPEEYKWIARDKDGSVFISFSKPFKDEDEDFWDIDDYRDGEVRSSYIWQFNHLFQSIKWEDEEPCEFRKYL